jgi:hypothetical protein
VPCNQTLIVRFKLGTIDHEVARRNHAMPKSVRFPLKDGREAEVFWLENVEGDNNRGFIVHQAVAVVDGEQVGYLKVSYVASERFRERYPTKESWNEVWAGLRRESCQPLDGNMSLTDHIEASVKSASKSLKVNPTKRIWNALCKKFGSQLAQFWMFHVDRPFVEFSRVYDASDRFYNHFPLGGRGEGAARVQVDYKNLGVGKAMIMASSLFLVKFGMNLRASGLQSFEAAAVWNSLEAQGMPVVHDARGLDPKLNMDRRYIDGPALAAKLGVDAMALEASNPDDLMLNAVACSKAETSEPSFR